MKKINSCIGLFFLTTIFFLQAMEVTEKDGEEKKKRVNKADLVINMVTPRKKNNNNLTVSSRTDRRGADEKQHTPRNFQELEDLVRVQSTQSKYVFPKDNEKGSLSGDGKKKDDEKDSTISVEDVKKNAQLLAEALKKDIHVEPGLMAQAVLNVHKANKDEPLSVETEKYEKMMRKDEDKYEDFLEQVLARMIIRHQLGEEHVEPSEQIVETHVGFLRKHITKRDKQLLWTVIAAGLSFLGNFGLTTWGAYLQSHCVNGTITG